jgi:ADP-ribosylglycohydrolase
VDVRPDQFAGCLIGQALGDALGFVVEGFPSLQCAAYVREAVRPRTLDGYGRGRFRFGQYSDDTQLARELTVSLVRHGGLEPADYASRIAAIFTEERIVGRGRATAEAACRISEGVPWEQAGTPAPAAGNGSAMRAAPIGLLYADPLQLIASAHDQGRITHQDRRSSAGAIAIAGATALLARNPGLAALELCRQLSSWTSDFDATFAAALEQLPDLITEPPEIAVDHIASVGMPTTQSVGNWDRISPFVTPSVLWSLYSVLRSPHDYWETVCTAIAVGGDVDTTASMAGAISGAGLGLGAIPGDEARMVTDRGEWGFDALVQLAHELHATYERRSSLPQASGSSLIPDP